MGADICGFNGNTTEELCGRWTELGAFYGFARNHNAIGSAPQEPYVWPSVAAIARKVLAARYSIINYIYALFFQANQNGGTVSRPLFFEFPSGARRRGALAWSRPRGSHTLTRADSNTLTIDSQFLLGPSLMVAPVLVQGATSLRAYLPAARWFDFWTGEEVAATGWQTFDAPFDHIPLFWRGGAMVPLQSPQLTIAATRQSPFSLLLVPDASGSAAGSFVLDDGESLNYKSNVITISCKGNVLSGIGCMASPASNRVVPLLGSLAVWGFEAAAVSSLLLNGMPLDASLASVNATTHVLSIDLSSAQVSLLDGIELTWSTTA